MIRWGTVSTIAICLLAGSFGWTAGQFVSARRTVTRPEAVSSAARVAAPLSHALALLPQLRFAPAIAQTKDSPVNLPVLMYHYVRSAPDPHQDPVGFNLSVTPQHFAQQMAYLTTNGYVTVTPSDLSAALQGKERLPAKAVLLTFDDGYEDFYQTVYPILQADHLRATLFVITGFVGEPDGRYVSWSQIQTMAASGLVTIGAHTETHVDLTKALDAWGQINGSKQALEAHGIQTVTSFAYPSGRESPAVVSLVQRAGFTTAFTTQPGRLHLFSRRLTSPRLRISGSTSLAGFIQELTDMPRSQSLLPARPPLLPQSSPSIAAVSRRR